MQTILSEDETGSYIIGGTYVELMCVCCGRAHCLVNIKHATLCMSFFIRAVGTENINLQTITVTAAILVLEVITTRGGP